MGRTALGESPNFEEKSKDKRISKRKRTAFIPMRIFIASGKYLGFHENCPCWDWN